MLLHAAIGDAYGAGFEFADRSKIDTLNTLVRYERHPLFDSIFKTYTDDTQMALAIAELLVEGAEWTTENIADKFVAVFKRDPRHGYAKRFYQLLSEVQSGEELLAKIIPKSERNGAAMRAYPLGLLKTEQEILEKTAIQARVTHTTESAVQAAQAIALMSHFYQYQKGDRLQLPEYLADYQSITWRSDWMEEVGMDGVQTVNAVLTVLQQETQLSAMLLKSVAFGGDVDTVASLVLAIACQHPEVEDDLPQWLFDELENGLYGRDYLMNMDKKLLL